MFLGFNPTSGSREATLAAARSLQRQRLCPGCAALRRDRTGTTWASRSTTSSPPIEKRVRRRPGADSRGDHRVIPTTACATPWATAPRPPTSTASCAGSGSRTCSSCTARPRPRSAPSAQKGDPRGSVGEIQGSRQVKILDEQGRGVPARRARRGRQDRQLRRGGRRDLPRVAEDTGCSRATSQSERGCQPSSKYRDGVYHSGDLGHILESSTACDSCSSTAAPTTGSARMARTSRPPRWRDSFRSTTTWCWRRPTGCPARYRTSS